MDERLTIATAVLNGLISSESGGIDRTKVNKVLWARVALQWADVLIEQSLAYPPGALTNLGVPELRALAKEAKNEKGA